jgi:membrane-associated protease RseP (regulator of RpoE activity)
MKLNIVVAVCATGIVLAGCATVFEGTTQEISVVTNPPGAYCVFDRQGMQVGAISASPGTANIRKSKYDIVIKCSKPGYQDAQYLNHSGTTATIAANVAADLLLTAGISSIVDSADGADNKYDSAVNITLLPSSNAASTISNSYLSPAQSPTSEHPVLGVVGSTVTATSSAAVHMRDPHGVFVTSLRAGSAAARAGLQPGDVVLSFNGLRIDTDNDLHNIVSTTAAGATVTLGVLRKGRQLDVPVQL